MKIVGYDIEFECSGKRLYTFGGSLSLHEDDMDEYGCVHYGSDGGISMSELTQAERREMALYVIGLWKKFGGIE